MGEMGFSTDLIYLWSSIACPCSAALKQSATRTTGKSGQIWFWVNGLIVVKTREVVHRTSSVIYFKF